jgi:cytidylate kinase
MSNKFVVTISREYGSGGRGIGQKLAERLGVGCYDKDLIAMTAEKSGLSAGFVENSEESAPSNLLLNVGMSFSGVDSLMSYQTPMTDKMFFAQSSVIKELAAKDSCVIIGRCADYVLRNEPGLVRVFIRADHEDRVVRAVASYNLPRKDAEKYVKKTDKTRSNYYKFYAGRAWGDRDHTDLMINTSFTGADGAVEVIMAALRSKGLA